MDPNIVVKRNSESLADIKPARVLILNQAELAGLKKLSLDPDVQIKLGCQDSEQAETKLVLGSKLEALPNGKRAVITPLTQLAFEEIRAASEKYKVEMFANVDYEITADGNSVILTKLKDLCDENHVLHVQKNDSKSHVDIERLIELIKDRVHSRYHAVEGQYQKLNQHADAKPEHPFAIRIKELGPELKEQLLSLFMNSEDCDDYKQGFEKLGVGPYAYSSAGKGMRVQVATDVAKDLEQISPESLSQFLGDRKLAELKPDERLDIAEKIITHPWRMIASHISASTTDFDREVRNHSSGVTIHTHPFFNAHLPGTSDYDAWLSAAWDKGKLEEKWKGDQFQGMLAKSIEEYGKARLGTSQLIIILEDIIALGDNKKAIYELLASKDIPESLVNNLQSLKYEADPAKIAGERLPHVMKHLANLGDAQKKVVKLKNEVLSAKDFQTACELIDRFGIPDDSSSIYQASPADKGTFSTAGRVKFPDHALDQLNFIVNCFGEATITYDYKLGTYSTKRAGLHNDTIVQSERRAGSDFDQEHKIIGNLYFRLYGDSCSLVSGNGVNAQPFLIEDKQTKGLALAIPEESDSGKLLLSYIEILKSIPEFKIDLQTASSKGESFQILNIDNLGGLKPADFRAIYQSSEDIETVKKLLFLWHTIGELKSPENPNSNAYDLVSERTNAVRELINAQTENAELCQSTVERVMNLDMNDQGKRNTFFYIVSNLSRAEEIKDLSVKEKIDLGIEKGINAAKRYKERDKEHNWWE